MTLPGDRIPTTHAGSLPRPRDLTAMLRRRDGAGEREDGGPELAARVEAAVAEVVARQATTGLDLINDGEQGKAGFSIYVKDRLSGFATPDEPNDDYTLADLADFPEFAARYSAAAASVAAFVRPVCVGPIGYRDPLAVERDAERLRSALATAGRSPAGAFLTAASPGVIAVSLENRHYPDHAAYVWALAEAMRTEYEAIHAAGFLLQLDCPDLAMGRHSHFAGESLATFRRMAAVHVAALNHATADIPPERMRLHLCWGNYEGPHHRDVPMRDVLDLVLAARPAGLSFEAVNPRHAHEWRAWEAVALPADKFLIPGVIDTTTNYVEHPALVAERLVRFASIVGRDRVVAGTDCGLSTFAGYEIVDPEIAWAKLGSLVEGARLASTTFQ